MVAGLSAMVIIFAVHVHLWAMHRQRLLALWTAAWGLALLRYAMLVFLPASLGGFYSLIIAAYTITFAAGLVLLTAGNYVLAGRRFPRWTLATLALAFAWVFTANRLGLDFIVETLPVYCSMAYLCFCGGAVLLGAENLHRFSRISAGMAMILSGLSMAVVGPLFMDEAWFAHWGWTITGVVYSWIGISLLVLYFQTQSQELEVAQKALAARERIYRLSANTMADGLLVVDDSLTVMYFNSQFQRIIGLGATQLSIGDDLRPALAALKSDSLAKVFLEAADKDLDRPRPIEIDSIVRSTGQEVSLRISPARLVDESGWFEGIVFLVTDITESRASARELAENRNLLHSIFSSMDEAVISLSADLGQVLYYNRSAAELTGLDAGMYSVSEFDYLTLLHPEDRASAGAFLKEMLQTGCAQWEHRVVSPSGQERTVRSRIKVSPAQGRAPARVDILLNDITEMRQAEKEIAERRWYFQALYENSMDPIIILNRDRVIIDANPAAKNISGLAGDGLVGSSTMDFHTDEAMFHRFAEEAHAMVRDRGYWRGAWPIRTQNYDDLYMEMSISVLRWGADGLPVLMMAIMRDITERTRYEQRLQGALAEKEVLLKEIHHRVKNNMQVVQSLLWMQAGKLKNPDIEKILQEVERRISAMSLVHETLYQTDNIASLDLGQYIQRLSSGLAQAFLNVSGNVQWNISADPIPLDLDKAMSFGLVLNELLTNSLKHAFSGAGGAITIKAKDIGGGLVEVVTADDGRGLGDQAETNCDTLGLALVRGLVERQLQGQLQINRGNGTEFVIRFSVTD